MGKVKYFYNEETLQFEKIEEPLSKKIFKVFGYFSAVIVTSIVLLSAFSRFFPSPNEQALKRELTQMEYKYGILTDKLDLMEKALDNIHERDASVQRIVFGEEPVDGNVWNGGIGGADHYKDINGFYTSGELLKQAEERVRRLAQKLTLESKSLDTLQQLSKDKEDKLASIPSIKPVREDKLKRRIKWLSGFGMRRHPIHKVIRMHKGIDFPAPIGTPIQATGNGKVIKVIKKRSGYGQHVVIDHGYGYTTLYAHMSEVLVKKGQKVVKGQVIGKVGSSGTSTGPHLHYEVRFHDRAINPIDFILDGLTPKEYQDLVNAAGVTNQSFD